MSQHSWAHFGTMWSWGSLVSFAGTTGLRRGGLAMGWTLSRKRVLSILEQGSWDFVCLLLRFIIFGGLLKRSNYAPITQAIDTVSSLELASTSASVSWCQRCLGQMSGLPIQVNMPALEPKCTLRSVIARMAYWLQETSSPTTVLKCFRYSQLRQQWFSDLVSKFSKYLIV